MFDYPAKIEYKSFQPDRRILVISDIHGNLPFLIALLKKVGFSLRDELIIDGDFLEKGKQSLETLRFLMEMSKHGNVHVIRGNCDNWHNIYRRAYSKEADEHTLSYVMWKKCGLIWDMLNSAGINPFDIEDFTSCKAKLRTLFKAEWEFLERLPDAIETERFIFAHAAVDPSKPLSEHTADELHRCDRFLDLGRSFEKWVVVGHYPVVLYGTDKVCANPLILRDRRIISIDGACVLKDDGQLNALIIPDKFSEDFSFIAYDDFPEMTVMHDQAEGERSYYIRWGDSTVRVLKRGEEFSHCRHVRTGYEMDILTKYLFTNDEYTDCNDCTDYVLPLKEGDTVSVVERTSRGYFVKHKGVSGWYFGELY